MARVQRPRMSEIHADILQIADKEKCFEGERRLYNRILGIDCCDAVAVEEMIDHANSVTATLTYILQRKEYNGLPATPEEEGRIIDYYTKYRPFSRNPERTKFSKDPCIECLHRFDEDFEGEYGVKVKAVLSWALGADSIVSGWHEGVHEAWTIWRKKPKR